MSAGFKITGIDHVKGYFRRTVPAISAESANRALRFAEAVMKESQAIVPFDTGALESSAYIRLRAGQARGEGGQFASGEQVRVDMGYQGIPYAAIQHEDLTFRHPNGRQAKYLERPVLSHAKDWPRAMADGVKGGLRKAERG